jgi:hypothetical protein
VLPRIGPRSSEGETKERKRSIGRENGEKTIENGVKTRGICGDWRQDRRSVIPHEFVENINNDIETKIDDPIEILLVFQFECG